MGTLVGVPGRVSQRGSGAGVLDYIGGAALALAVGFIPFLEIYVAVPAATAVGLDYGSAVIWSVVGNFVPVLLITFAYDRLMRIERIRAWLTGRRSARFQRAVNRYGGWAILILAPWVGIWVVAATAQALGMRRAVLVGFSLASIIGYAVLVAVAIALGIEAFTGSGAAVPWGSGRLTLGFP